MGFVFTLEYLNQNLTRIPVISNFKNYHEIKQKQKNYYCKVRCHISLKVYISLFKLTWILSVKALSVSAGNSTEGEHCEMRGMIVTPA